MTPVPRLMKTLRVPRKGSLLDNAAASVSGDVTDVMCLDSVRAPADLHRHSTPDITGEGLRALMTVTRQLAEALCQCKVKYLKNIFNICTYLY